MKRFSIIGLVSLMAFSAFGAELKVIYEEDPTLLVTNVRVVIQSGAAADPMERSGLSHLMSELMLRGTKRRSRAKFQSELERLGASLGVATTHDAMAFHGAVIKENTGKFMELLEDFLLNPAFDKKEFEAIKKENLSELAHTKNQNNRLGGLMIRREAFAGSPLARPTTGSLATVRSITREDVLRAYNNAFHRGNILFGLASALKQEELEKPLRSLWLRFPDGARQTAKPVVAKMPAAPTLIVVHKPNTSTGSLILGQPGISVKDADRYTLGVANFSFGGEPLVSRLFRIVRGELGYTYSIFSSYTAMGNLSLQPGMYVIAATPSIEHTIKTLLKVQEMWNGFLEDGLKSDELRLAHESVVNSYPFQFDSAQKRVSEKVESYLYDVPVLSPEEFEKKITSISNSEIKKALKARQSAAAWWVAVVADKDVIQKQLADAQKDLPEAKRLTIAKVVTPEEVIQ